MKFDKKKLREALLLYAVTNGQYTEEREISEALSGGATMIQLREKGGDSAAFLDKAKRFLPICHRYQAPLIINDSLEVALSSGADGLHIGQNDGPVEKIRRSLGDDLILGVSAHSVTEALCAWRSGADYLGVGAIFPTSTKSDTELVSRETLREICSTVPIPVVAIGGITLSQLSLLSHTGIAGIAVVSALFHSDDIQKTAQLFHSHFVNHWHFVKE